jgi:hypothetical protein
MKFEQKKIEENKSSIPRSLMDLAAQYLTPEILTRLSEEKEREVQSMELIVPDQQDKVELIRLLQDYTLITPTEDVFNTHSLSGTFLTLKLLGGLAADNDSLRYTLLLQAKDAKDRTLDLSQLGIILRSEHGVEVHPQTGKSGLIFSLDVGTGYSITCAD